MTTDISIPNMKAHLAMASTPQETQSIEAVSKVAMAYAAEQNNYELYMLAWRLYIDARRKTTALILDGNMHVTDFGFTKMQWSRRMAEYRIAQEKLDEYFDAMISSGWQPSINGFIRHANGSELDREDNARNEVRRGTRTLKKEFGHTLEKIFQLVRDAFSEA